MDQRTPEAEAENAQLRVAACLLREGLGVYAPVIDDCAIDFLIGRADGGLDEIQVKSASRGRRFQVTTQDPPEQASLPHRWLICVGEGDEAWIFPAQVYFANATRSRDARGDLTYDLDLDATPQGEWEPHATRLAAYRNAWRLLREGAR